MFLHLVEYKNKKYDFKSEFTKPEFVAEDFILHRISAGGPEDIQVHKVFVNNHEVNVLKKIYLEGVLVKSPPEILDVEDLL